MFLLPRSQAFSSASILTWKQRPQRSIQALQIFAFKSLARNTALTSSAQRKCVPKDKPFNPNTPKPLTPHLYTLEPCNLKTWKMQAPPSSLRPSSPQPRVLRLKGLFPCSAWPVSKQGTWDIEGAVMAWSFASRTRVLGPKLKFHGLRVA